MVASWASDHMSELLLLYTPCISADMSEAGFPQLPLKFRPAYTTETQPNGGKVGSEAKDEGVS